MIRNKLIVFRGSRSQEEMGKMYEVTQQAWSYWELGLKKPSVMIMKQIELDSGIPMEELFCDVFDNVRLSKDQKAV